MGARTHSERDMTIDSSEVYIDTDDVMEEKKNKFTQTGKEQGKFERGLWSAKDPGKRPKKAEGKRNGGKRTLMKVFIESKIMRRWPKGRGFAKVKVSIGRVMGGNNGNSRSQGLCRWGAKNH